MLVSFSGGDITLSNVDELISLIRRISAKGTDEIWISSDDAPYPALAVQVNGGSSCVNYFGNEDGDMYMSLGDGCKEVVFTAGSVEWIAPDDAVIPLRKAEECAAAFCRDFKKPSCISWQKLCE